MGKEVGSLIRQIGRLLLKTQHTFQQQNDLKIKISSNYESRRKFKKRKWEETKQVCSLLIRMIRNNSDKFKKIQFT